MQHFASFYSTNLTQAHTTLYINNAETFNPVYTVCNKHHNKMLAIVVTTVTIPSGLSDIRTLMVENIILSNHKLKVKKSIFDDDVGHRC